jgi:hypothetical protein
MHSSRRVGCYHGVVPVVDGRLLILDIVAVLFHAVLLVLHFLRVFVGLQVTAGDRRRNVWDEGSE